MYPPSLLSGFADPPDLALLVERALDKELETRGCPIDIIARGGTIVLLGQVSLEAVKIAAEKAALSVPGVKSVENRIILG